MPNRAHTVAVAGGEPWKAGFVAVKTKAVPRGAASATGFVTGAVLKLLLLQEDRRPVDRVLDRPPGSSSPLRAEARYFTLMMKVPVEGRSPVTTPFASLSGFHFSTLQFVSLRRTCPCWTGMNGAMAESWLPARFCGGLARERDEPLAEGGTDVLPFAGARFEARAEEENQFGRTRTRPQGTALRALLGSTHKVTHKVRMCGSRNGRRFA